MFLLGFLVLVIAGISGLLAFSALSIGYLRQKLHELSILFPWVTMFQFTIFFSPPLFIVLLIFISHNVQGVLVDGKNREIDILIILLGSFSGILNYLYIV